MSRLKPNPLSSRVHETLSFPAQFRRGISVEW
jgi:hypothetical protein